MKKIHQNHNKKRAEISDNIIFDNINNMRLIKFRNIKNIKNTLTKLPVISWALHDLANTSFAIVIITIAFPIYFTNIIVSPDLYPPNTGVYYGD